MQAYFDCFSGISGDMTLGALIDLGAPLDWLQDELSRLPLKGFRVTATPVMRNGIRATFANVEIENSGHSRDYKKIKSLLEDCLLSDAVKSRSLAIFETLARAEAGIHGCDLYEVHFHEVGGIDAIVDIVGTALCMEYLGIDTVISSKIPLGSGFVKCQHGTLPVPVPGAGCVARVGPVRPV